MLGSRHDAAAASGGGGHAHDHDEGGSDVLKRLFNTLIGPFLAGGRGKLNRWLLLAGVLVLIAGSMLLAVNRVVIMKMLPFDNKSEFQVVLDMPEGTSLEQTARVLGEMGEFLSTVPEVANYQVYAGTAAPINFNGLVRQYYLREGAHLGDIQVNLVDKHHRDDKSHKIALRLREPLQAIARQYDGNAKLVEIPPGPPVLSPLVAEVYGIDYDGQIAIAKQVREVFGETADIVDIDDSVEYPSEKVLVVVDRAKAARLGVEQASVAQALATVLDGEDMSFLHGANVKYAVPIRVEYDAADKADLEQVLALRVRSMGGQLVPLSEIVDVVETTRAHSIYHKDLLPVVYVTGDMAGPIDSPLYGLFAIAGQLTDSACRSGTCSSRTTPTSSASNGTANGRSPMRPSVTWGWPTASACC
jgi:multidrug efflux pump subunit AcrB